MRDCPSPAKKYWAERSNTEGVKRVKVPLLELAAGMVETVFQAVIGGLRKILGQVKRQLVGLPMVFSCLAV